MRRASSLSPEVKEQVRATSANIILYYKGYDTSPLEQYVALAVVAGALSSMGAVAVLNESAHTSLPAGYLSLRSWVSIVWKCCVKVSR